MKLKVEKQIAKGLASGKDSSGNIYFIENGDLFIGQEIDFDITGNQIAKHPKLNYNLDNLILKYGDKHNLIHHYLLREIKLSTKNDRIFELGDYWVFPDKVIYKEVEVLLDETNLWEQSRILISNNSRQTISLTVPVSLYQGFR